MTDTRTSRIRLDLPVTVLLEKRTIVRKFWSLPSWSLGGVLAGDAVVHKARRGIRLRESVEGVETWSWSGHKVTLYKDACERYWHALIGDEPKVYVVCRDLEGESGAGTGAGDEPLPTAAIEPLVVTVDYDEATAFAETDQQVLSAPIPGDLYRYMEAFVLEHYRPQKFEKRKRRNWSAESDQARRRPR